jgi:hypothetical protein
VEIDRPLYSVLVVTSRHIRGPLQELSEPIEPSVVGASDVIRCIVQIDHRRARQSIKHRVALDFLAMMTARTCSLDLAIWSAA